ncbi:MAG: ribonuclease HII, partial [Planctomycetes bacterium]|nr:ribonuclease HII [Planctomycetota bacterium]
MAPGFGLERKSGGLVAGLDEVGRGPLAGPVVAAAAVLNEAAAPPGLDDSKKLTADQREALSVQLRTVALIGIGAASVAEIDRLNILAASLLAMRRALDSLVWRMGRLPDLA